MLTICRPLRRALAGLLVTGAALAALLAAVPAARADGDPGSDVLVYQNLFVTAYANMPIQQEVELGNLLTAAGKAGFPVRVAVISQPSDLGAVTALWDKPDAYARFLGVELSLAYKQRLLIVMPNGFGFYWTGHPAAAAYQVLNKLRVGTGGSGLGTAAESAVLALASASGIHLTAPPAAAPGTGAAGAPSAPAATAQPAAPAPSGLPVPLIAGLAAVALVAAGGWFAYRRGALRLLAKVSRPGWLRPPRLAGRGSWLAGGFVALAATGIIVHAVIQPSASQAQDTGQAISSQLTENPDLDPGASLSVPAPGFTLTDQFGQPVSLSSFRGKVVILAFNDAECTTVCPLTTAALVQAKAMLGPAAARVQLLGVDANPKATQVQDLLSYSRLHGMTYQWRYLTGSLTQLENVWKAYSVGVTISQNQIDHEPAIFIISPQGKLVKLYLTQQAYAAIPQLAQLLATEVAGLLPGHPKVDSQLSYAQVSGFSPASDQQLPTAGGGYTSLGPGQPAAPRLSLFFATWDQEVTTLAGQLDALNAYQSAAGAAGLPGLTAVDEGSVEPSATALPQFLTTLHQPLSYPVAIDATGQVADGYGVQGQPWFVLTSASGQVIWSWQVSVSGWPSRAALQQHVRAALAVAAKPN